DHSANIISLIDEGNTIPFIARYRKEMTGSCDDQVLREFADRLTYLVNLDARKAEVEKSITDQGKWTDEIKTALEKAMTLAEVEDIYRPYKQKKKTRASVAIEKGLLPLAEALILEPSSNPEDLAITYVNTDLGVETVKDALDGASDIIAEKVSDDAELRKALRELFLEKGEIETKGVDPKKMDVYEMYVEYKESVATIPAHRILAINRGEKEDFLKVSISVPEETAIAIINKKYVKRLYPSSLLIKTACADGYKRLISPSLEREVRATLTERAEEQSIKMFELNLKPLLMQPPLRGKVVLALDPAYRTGCKVAVLSPNGDVLARGVVYPTPPQNQIEDATIRLLKAIDKYKVDVIAIGNGTASKETEIFVAGLIKKASRSVSYTMVNEAGASVYSASKLGAEEFPDYDVTQRSAISIGRRLQDPLAELIKIDVKSIGVGQYQHDMPQKRLTEVLEGVVEDCVNKVGVELNTASYSLLTYVSGLNKTIAKNIVEYRTNNPFKNRAQLLKVHKLGAKAYEQCAGFLRIRDGEDVLDNTGVHPESYDATKALLKEFGYTKEDVEKGRLSDLKAKVENYGVKKLAEKLGIGAPTLVDIVTELMKPGRDVRDT
ncbi:MAG: RNA-binding transcriptional accessory protein, partial [Clostridia bacterium]|nr:RNA-binding transcriptional accessory protein [Clostridia bacterium]